MKTVPITNIFLSSTGNAESLSYPITQFNSTNFENIYRCLIYKDESIACEVFGNTKNILTYPEIDLGGEKIIVNNDDYIKFEKHLEQTKEIKNIGLEKLLNKFL